MAGYIGGRAKRRRRNFIIFFILLIFLILAMYIIPLFKLDENIPSDTLLPSKEELENLKITSTIEELELQVFDKEQKILFRNNQIDKLKLEIKNLLNENKKLVDNFKSESNLSVNQSEKIRKINSEFKIINANSKKEIKELNNIINKITDEKNDLILLNNDNQKEINFLKKEYKGIVSKNLKLNNINDNINKKIRESEDLIEEQNLIIKILEDTTHH